MRGPPVRSRREIQIPRLHAGQFAELCGNLGDDGVMKAA